MTDDDDLTPFEDDETGELAGQRPAEVPLALAIADLRAGFDRYWPGAGDVFPMRQTDPQTHSVQTMVWWIARARMTDELLAFLQTAPLLDNEELEIQRHVLMETIHDRAERTLKVIRES